MSNYADEANTEDDATAVAGGLRSGRMPDPGTEADSDVNPVTGT